jgi:hypothetical protein
MSLIIFILAIIFGLGGGAFDDDPVARRVDVPPECVVATESTGEQGDGCGAADRDDWNIVEIDGVQGAIVTETNGPLFIDSDAYWTPSVVDIADAETAILQDEGELGHTRQYVGFLEDGQRKISINGFCDDMGYDWEHEPVVVDDGGDCFFTAVYDMETGALEWFTFNGDA